MTLCVKYSKKRAVVPSKINDKGSLTCVNRKEVFDIMPEESAGIGEVAVRFVLGAVSRSSGLSGPQLACLGHKPGSGCGRCGSLQIAGEALNYVASLLAVLGYLRNVGTVRLPVWVITESGQAYWMEISGGVKREEMTPSASVMTHPTLTTTGVSSWHRMAAPTSKAPNAIKGSKPPKPIVCLRTMGIHFKLAGRPQSEEDWKKIVLAILKDQGQVALDDLCRLAKLGQRVIHEFQTDDLGETWASKFLFGAVMSLCKEEKVCFVKDAHGGQNGRYIELV